MTRRRPGRILVPAAVGAALVLGAFLLVERGVVHPEAVRSWVEGRGVAGMALFVVLFVASTSLFVPDTLLAIVAGAVWGLGVGTLLVTVGGVLGALLQYGLARRWLRGPVARGLSRRPRLAACVAAVRAEGFRLQLLLRLTPVNPPTVSYALGATGVPPWPYAIALLGLVPAFFAEVYVGYAGHRAWTAARDPAGSAPVEQGALLAGVVALGLVLFLVGRRARRLLAGTDVPGGGAPGDDGRA